MTEQMTLLTLACVALFMGPLLYQLVSRNGHALKVIDGFVFVSISGLLLIHLIGEEGGHFGLWPLCLLLLGLLGPLFLERFFSRLEEEVHVATLLLGAIGFLVHAGLDGAALALNTHHPLGGDGDISLAAAIVIHRIPVGLTLWWLLKPRFSVLTVVGVLTFTVISTIGGYGLAESVVVQSLDYTFPYVQAFVAGSILHVVLFRFHLHGHASQGKENVSSCCSHETVPEVDTDESGWSKWISNEGIGNLLGILLLISLMVLLPSEHQHHEGSGIGIWESFTILVLESSPALLFAYVAGIFIYGFFPESSIQWMKKGGRVAQSAKGMLVGLPLPICSCGVLPYYQTLVKKGAPPAAAIAFLIATPELGVDAIFLSFPLLGVQLTVIRLIASAIIAFVVAWIISRHMAGKSALPVLSNASPQTAKEKLAYGARFALVELVDTTAPWMLFGLVLAAVAGPLMQQFHFAVPDPLQVLLFSGIGLIVYVCASGATPLVAALLAGGVSPGAGLSFLIAGPATNISTFGVLSQLHGKRIAFLFGALMMGAAIVAGIVANELLPNFQSVLSLSNHAHGSDEVFVWWRVLAAILIGMLFLSSLVRQGGRKFFGHVAGDQL